MLISISGYYGSGGNELGWELSKALGFKVYDREIIAESVESSGVDMKRSTIGFYDEEEDAIDAASSTPYAKALLSLQMDVLPIGMSDREHIVHKPQSGLLSRFLSDAPISHTEGTPVRKREDIERLVKAQTKVVLNAADKGDAIFFGRCSSYILEGRADALRIFTTASLDSCRERIAGIYKLPDKEQADVLITKTNRRRAYYYETFTGRKWDDAENYDFCINTDYLGFDDTLKLVKRLIELKSK